MSESPTPSVKVKLPEALFFAIRTTAQQEINVAIMVEAHAKVKNLPIYSIVVVPELRGYIIIEATGLHVVYEAIRGLKHVKGRASGTIKWEDLEKLLKPKPLIEILQEGDEVEVTAGPLRGARAKVVAIDRAKNEVTLNIFEAQYAHTVTVPVEWIKIVKKVGSSA